MKIDDNILRFFAFDIFLPDESSSKFGIFYDLAELFGLEYNEEAVKLLRKTLRASSENPKRKAQIDWEADRVSVIATQPSVIFTIAKTINELSLPQYRQFLDETTSSRLAEILESWERPKPQKWGVGDVFYFSLCDGAFVYGQVLAKDYYGSTCALFELKTERIEKDLQVMCKRSVITILHVGPELLDKGIWTVLGSHSISIDPDSGPGGRRGQVGCRSFDARILVQLAEAYYGLIPWNAFYRENYLDELLMKPFKRPPKAVILSPREREQYMASRQ